MGNATIAKDENCHHFANHPRPSPTSVVCFPGSLLSCWPRPEKALFEAHFSAHVSVCGVLVTLCEQPWFQVVATFCLDLCRHTLTSGIRACSPTPYRQRTLLKLHQFANPTVVGTQCACFASWYFLRAPFSHPASERCLRSVQSKQGCAQVNQTAGIL